MNRKLFLSSAFLVCAVLLVAVGVYEPTRILRGLLFKENFFKGRPTSYWREVIRAEGEAGAIQPEISDLFDSRDAVDVLQDCFSDSDPNVRWPAVYLIHKAGEIRASNFVARKALDDPDVAVRFTGIRVLGWLRREAWSAAPRLAEFARDENMEIRTAANHSLWEIDEEAALQAGGWSEFTSEERHFTVTIPGIPDMTRKPVDTPYGAALTESFSVPFGLAGCVVAVIDHSQQFPPDYSIENHYDSTAERTAAALGGRLVHNVPIDQNGYVGREQVIEVESEVVHHFRVFLIGNRTYQVDMSYPPGTVSLKAVNYFLDSFRINEPSD